MNWRALIYVCCILLFICGCSKREEATYQGKKASEWIQMASDADPKTRLQAIEALVLLGRTDAREAVVVALVGAFGDQDPEVRRQAAIGLGQVGPAAVPAVVRAMTTSARDNVYEAANRALYEISVPYEDVDRFLESALKSEDSRVPELIKLRFDVQKIHELEVAHDALVRGYECKDERVRARIGEMLGGIWEEVDSLEPLVQELAKSRDEDVQKIASIALAAIARQRHELERLKR